MRLLYSLHQAIKRTSWIKIFLFFAIVALLSACNNRIALDDTGTIIDKDYHWTTFYETSDGTLYVGGGLTWDLGVIADLAPSGWELSFSANNSQVLSFAEAEGKLYALDYNGYRYYKESDGWHTAEPLQWLRMHKIISLENSLLVVGSERMRECRMYFVTGERMETWKERKQDLGFYVMAADMNSNGELCVAGYGNVYSSPDTGKTWVNITPDNGIFRMVQAVDNVFFLMNDKGAVFKKMPDSDWEKIHNARVDRRFNGMYFVSESEGYIVGDNGLILATSDGGDSWKTYRLDEKIVLNAAYKKEGILYVCGNEGLILELEDF